MKKFKQQVVAWRKAGWVAPWDGKLVALDHGVVTAAGRAAERSKQRFVALPGMSALGQQLAQGLDIRAEQLVARIESLGQQWLLAIQSDTVPIDASAGPFDAVLVAAPAAGALLQALPKFAKQADQVHFEPCWSLILGFQESLGLPYDGAWVHDSRLAWIAHDSSKPQRRPGEHWVGHASAAWSLEHFDDGVARAKEKLVKAFHEATGSQVQPIYAAVHRWSYAQATQPLDGDCLWDKKLRIGACGDWFAAGLEGAGRVENAYLSGLALAEAVAC